MTPVPAPDSRPIYAVIVLSFLFAAAFGPTLDRLAAAWKRLRER